MLGVSTSSPPLNPGCPQPMSSERKTTMLGGLSPPSTDCADTSVAGYAADMSIKAARGPRTSTHRPGSRFDAGVRFGSRDAVDPGRVILRAAVAQITERGPAGLPWAERLAARHLDQQHRHRFALAPSCGPGVEPEPAQDRQPSEGGEVRDRIARQTQPHEVRQVTQYRDIPQPVAREIQPAQRGASPGARRRPPRGCRRGRDGRVPSGPTAA